MHNNIIMRKDNKLFFAVARLFWPEGRFWDFFGLKKAEGLLKAKKIPKTARRPKQAWLKQKQFFCHSKWWEMSCIDPWITFFCPKQVFSPSKSKFPSYKNSYRIDNFFCLCLQRKQECAQRRKTLLWAENNVMLCFMEKCTTISSWGRTKNFFCCSQVVLAWGPFLGFFWPEEGRRPSEGQKNPKNGPKAKTSLAKAKTVFLSFQMMRNVVHWPMNNIFLPKASVFPLKK